MPPPCSLLVPVSSPNTAVHDQILLSKESDHLKHSDVGSWGVPVSRTEATVSFVMAVRLYKWTNSVPTGRIVQKFDVTVFFENMLTELKFYYNLTTTRALHMQTDTF